MITAVAEPFTLLPELQARVWGGGRLHRAADPIGEAWLVHENNIVEGGPFTGLTLSELAARLGPDLLGTRAVARTGHRFPLLLKLLDTADWLSVQVHPNDRQALAFEGPGVFGKAEAWHVLEAQPGARVIAGLRGGTTSAGLRTAVANGTVLDVVHTESVQTGDTLLIPTGLVHAPGPGLLLYEVQQSSDVTYRLFDWNRPPVASRPLHVEKSLAVADTTAATLVQPRPDLRDGERALVATSAYFLLELLRADARPISLTTGRESFHALTAVSGEADIRSGSHCCRLGTRQSVIVPAACGAYEICPRGGFTALLASVP